MLGMQGGNQQAAGIGNAALAGNAGAYLLGGAAPPPPRPSVFSPGRSVADFMTDARQQVAARPAPVAAPAMQNSPYGGSLFPGGQAPAAVAAAQPQAAAAPPPQSPALAYQMREMQADPYYQLTQMQAGVTPPAPTPQAPSWEENPYYWLSSGQQPPAPTQQLAQNPADWRTWTNGG